MEMLTTSGLAFTHPASLAAISAPPKRLERQRVGISFAVKGTHRELAEAVREELGYRGHDVQMVGEQSLPSSEFDLVLLINASTSTDTLLREIASTSQRPRIVLWQTETLPPPDLAPDSERIALTASGWSLDSAHPLWKRLKPLVPTGDGLARAWRNLQGQTSEAVDDAFQGVPVDRVNLVVNRWQRICGYVAEGRVDRVVASTWPSVEFLRSRGIAADWAPVGYHPRFGTPSGDPEAASWFAAKDIDVLCFSGKNGSWAESELNWLKNELVARGVRMVTASEDCCGADREQLFRRARIVVNAAQFPWEPLAPWLAIAMGCKTLVLSEAMANSHPFHAGEHYVECPRAQLPEAVAWHLSHPDYAQELTTIAYRFVTRAHTLRKSLAVILGG